MLLGSWYALLGAPWELLQLFAAEWLLDAPWELFQLSAAQLLPELPQLGCTRASPQPELILFQPFKGSGFTPQPVLDLELSSSHLLTSAGFSTYMSQFPDWFWDFLLAAMADSLSASNGSPTFSRSATNSGSTSQR